MKGDYSTPSGEVIQHSRQIAISNEHLRPATNGFCIEIRQDLISDSQGQGRWAQTIAEALELVLKREDLYRSRVG